MAFRANQRKTKGGVENSGEGKTYHKTSPQKRFWTPPTYDTFTPPPVCSRNVIFLRGNGHRADQTHFLSHFVGHTLWCVFPQNCTIRFAPPYAVSQAKCTKSRKRGVPARKGLLEKDEGATRLEATGPRVSERKIFSRRFSPNVFRVCVFLSFS